MTKSTGGAPWRISLREMLIGSAIFAVVTIALANASTIWVAVMTNLCVILYLSAASVALTSDRETRTCAIGFIVWGVSYLIVAWLISNRPHGDGPLATSWALWYLHGYIARELPPLTANYGTGAVFSVPQYFPDQDSFRLVGEIGWSWFFAVLGGFITRGLFRRGRQTDADRGLDGLDQ